MAEFVIKDEDLNGLKGKVVIVTGTSSGIGLATANLLLSLGASVVGGDIQPSATPESTPNWLFVQTNVTVWTDLSNLFKKAKEHFGRIDHVYANAGIGPRANYLALETDANGELKEPTFETLDVNLKSVMNTATLAVHYIKQQPEGGSVVLMGSSTGLQPLRAPDYSTAKHGVLGFGRGYGRLVQVAGLPIRINTLMPSWTSSNILPNLDGMMQGISHEAQPGLVVARCVAYLMSDTSKHGEAIYVSDGKYKEIEKAVLSPTFKTSILGEGNPNDDEILERMLALGK
ncbi:hydroxyacyl dehydrogenase, putative [Talaromyces stipitatus ATCC 10500]|uniref:Hydroxyacyl dehydrogenase, putative n=1 Tax=Talaromyces stipitatus (strain ATCC 10500 / CBS 375.48 / QM 6759 / NRRL 1006) TaxID=441959 RepID=B8LZ25_TALSN|nr:hydroxyacyl dehydrogenase, putative [Talaromyces stipitatus ATCC 10500]EED21069.1 hydroxyacyl dehydrogenase, putative [Talaromyces stipitatus ATCC 10500]